MSSILALGVYTPEFTYERPETIETPTLDIKRTISDFQANERDIEIGLAIVEAESDYNNVCNQEHGCIAGIGPFQIVQSTFDEQCEGSPYNINDNIKCGMKLIENGEYWRWEQSMDKWLPQLSQEIQNEINYLCDCMQGLRENGVYFNGRAKDIPIGDMPVIGGVAKFYYKSVGTYHGAEIVGFTTGGISVCDTNYKPCKETCREVLWDNESLLGFWNPWK